MYKLLHRKKAPRKKTVAIIEEHFGRGSKKGKTEKTPTDGDWDNSEEITYQAALFKHNLLKVLQENPEKIMAVAIDTDIGAEQQAQIMPVWIAIDQIADMRNERGDSLFPNLRKIRGSGSDGTLMQRIQEELIDNPKIMLEKSDLFLVGRQANINNSVFDSLKGEAWITGIDDSKAGREVYLPVFEAITLTFMAALKADIESLKNFYNSISEEPVTIERLREMIRNKLIYILPKMTRKTQSLRGLYERVRTIYLAA
jgi:hypothetical protein